MRYYISYPENLVLFETYFKAIKLFAKVIGKIALQAPLLITGYLMANYILNKTSNLLVHLGFTICIAYLCYLAIYFVKGIIISLRSNRNYFWVPILLIMVFFVCMLPVLILLQTDFKFINALTTNNLLQPVIVFIYFIYAYSRYSFLKNVAPRSVYIFYQAGISITNRLLHFRIPGSVTRIIFGK